MRKHALHGYEILRGIEFLGNARLVVRSHHERFDGKGYPDKLVGDGIPMGARIFAVIDTHDAMTSDRPYRKALSPRQLPDCGRGAWPRRAGDPQLLSAWPGSPRRPFRGSHSRSWP